MLDKTVSVLDRASLERINSESLRLLQNVGIYVGDPECVKVLKAAGAKVVGQSNVVCLPPPMVLEAVDQITKTYELVDLRGGRIPLPSDRPRAGCRVKMPKFLDYGAPEARRVGRQDVINLCRIASSLPKIDFSLLIDTPSHDVQPEIDYADCLALAFAITGHPILTAPTTEAGMRTCHDVAIAASESGDLEQDPNLFVCVDTASPLKMAAEAGQVLRYAVARGIPVDVEPIGVAGASTPFTLAGTLLVENAETLFLLCLANAIRPGAKVMESTLGTLMNMKAANFSMAAPESMLLASAEATLTRLRGLPAMRMGGYTDSYNLDIQAGIEKSAFTLMIALSGADLVLMGGPLNNAAHQSCESALIDHDIWELVERCTTEIQVDDETLAYDTIAEVGTGGSHVETRHTLRWLRSGEHYYGGSYNRSGRAGEEYTMLARAHERVEEILSQPLEYGAPPEAVERIKQVLRDEAKSLGVAMPDWSV